MMTSDAIQYPAHRPLLVVVVVAAVAAMAIVRRVRREMTGPAATAAAECRMANGY